MASARMRAVGAMMAVIVVGASPAAAAPPPCPADVRAAEALTASWRQQGGENTRFGQTRVYGNVRLTILGKKPVSATTLHNRVGGRFRSVSFELPGAFAAYVPAARASIDPNCTVAAGACTWSAPAGRAALGGLETAVINPLGPAVSLTCFYRAF